MNTKRKYPNSLNMQKRIQILDWLRAHSDDLPNMSRQEVVNAEAQKRGLI